MQDNKKTQENGAAPQWLQSIQLNSWEAELLISALVLYALFRIPESLDYWSLNTFPRGSNLHGLISVVQNAIQLLSLGYILHILVRGVWVATVGFSYVFPAGVDTERLKFRGRFKKELESNGSLVRNVLRLEELSSMIYGISFILFGTLFGFGVFLFSFIFFVEWMKPLTDESSSYVAVLGFVSIFYFLAALLVFIDFITNGLFRRKEWAIDWFYPLALIFRIITLSFLYRKSILVLISNLKGWRSYLVPILILAMVAGFLFVKKRSGQNQRLAHIARMSETAYFGSSYENTRQEDDYLVATIQSDIVDQSFLKVFLKDLKLFNSINPHDQGIKSTWFELSQQELSSRLNKWLNVRIDDDLIENIEWFDSQHVDNYEFGFVAFIDISNLERGNHSLSIDFDLDNMKERAAEKVIDDGYAGSYLTNIYFIYDPQ